MKTKKHYIEETHLNTEFEQRIGKTIEELSAKEEAISLAEIETWVEKDEMKKRERRKRMMSVAACFIVICGVGLSMRYYVHVDDPIAMAGRDDTKVVTEVDGKAVIGSNGDRAEENVGESEEVHTTWEAVLEAKEKYPDMLLPGYIPEGYEFKELRIVVGSDDTLYEFRYSTSDAKEVCISEKPNHETTVVINYDSILRGSHGQEIYIINNKNTIQAMFTIEGKAVNIYGNLNEGQMLELANALSK